VGIIILIITWAFIKRNVALLLLTLFLLGYNNLRATWALNISSGFNNNKDAGALRILSWNVRYFDNNARHADSAGASRRRMIEFIKQVQADVILLQDFSDYLKKETYFSNVETIRDTLGYKYVLTSNDYVDSSTYGGVIQGSAIFSKIPISDTGKIIFKDIAEPESVCYADLFFANKPMRLYTTHLVSMNIHPHTGIMAEPGREKVDSAYKYGKKVTKTIKQFDQIHAKQADFIKNILSASPYPSIISGDFNSVPSSYVYHTIKGNKKDAFIEKGFGLGHSYYALSKTLRIDYVLADKSFKILQVTTPSLYLSDHFPVITDIKWAD
jgi:endonuclease/exonuclease/phosphatase family metal-dependent hydrolase